MCEQCLQLDLTIDRFRRVERSINETLTVGRAKAVIRDLEVKKATLQPKRMEQSG